jgi:hypothetical protein
MEMHIDAIFSALLGSGFASALAKAYISKSLSDLEKVSEKVSEIKSELSAIAVKLENTEKDRDIILTHERKIAAMENQIYGYGIPRKSSSTA